MRLFLDSNIWISAFGTDGLCRALVRAVLGLQTQGVATICLSEQVVEETIAALREKFRLGAEAIEAALETLGFCQMVAPDLGWTPPVGFPDPDDIPILAAALAAGADLFVTGDKALLALGEIAGLPIVDARTAYERLDAVS